MSSALSESSRSSCRMTSTYGLISWMLSRADSALGLPMSDTPWMICRCRLDSSTTSKSTMPSVPTPAAARYSSAGEPSPPAPTTRTFAFFSRFCPVMPTSGMMRCREYRFTSSTLSSSAGSTRGGNDTVLSRYGRDQSGASWRADLHNWEGLRLIPQRVRLAAEGGRLAPIVALLGRAGHPAELGRHRLRALHLGHVAGARQHHHPAAGEGAGGPARHPRVDDLVVAAVDDQRGRLYPGRVPPQRVAAQAQVFGHDGPGAADQHRVPVTQGVPALDLGHVSGDAVRVHACALLVDGGDGPL